jgi:hypothetical protein
MPENATFEQRVEWHEAHARECGCRNPPADISARIEANRAAADANSR